MKLTREFACFIKKSESISRNVVDADQAQPLRWLGTASVKEKENNNMRTPGLIKVVLSVLLVSSGLLHAAPVINDFSSKGGRTTNKAGPKDRMYLAKPGDKITFAVKADGAKEYEWQVNKKVDAKATGDSFVWTVPDEKGIWEIHLTVSGGDGGGVIHQEWVVSTLAKADAPDIFDYFADGKYQGRTETDPWGRPAGQWKKLERNADGPKVVYDASTGWMQKKSRRGYVFLPSKIAFGTWRIRYRDNLDYCFVGKMRDGSPGYGPGQYIYNHAGTGHYSGHMWFRGVLPRSLFPPEKFKVNYGSYGYPSRYSLAWGRGIAMYGSGLYFVPGWIDLKIIHTPDGSFYQYVNDRAMLGMFNIDDTFKIAEFIRTGSKTFDCVEIYKDKYLFPEKSAEYGEYPSGNEKQTEKGLTVGKKKGVILGGRGLRLKDIAKLLNKPSLFKYDAAKKTATCYTNLVIGGATELILENETLKMHCDSAGQYEIRVMDAATLKVLNSTITSDTDHHYLWRFTSPYESENYKVAGTRSGMFDARCIFIAKGSTIDNCGYIYLQSPRGLVLEDTKFTNLVETTAGRKAKAYTWRDSVGTKTKVAFWFLGRMPTVPLRSFRNVQFSGKAGKPVSIVFDGGDPFGQLNIYDSTFTDAVVSVRSFNKICGGGRKSDWLGEWGIVESSRTLNLVNCKIGTLAAPTKYAWANVRYYLDVKVVDKNGKAVPGAKVRIINESDDVNCPAVSSAKGWKWTSTYGEGFGNHLVPYKKWKAPPALRETITGKDGHTPGPSDKLRCPILTDYTYMNSLNCDKIELSWQTYNKNWAMELNVYDAEKGHIIRSRKENIPYSLLGAGHKHHVKVSYDKKGSLLDIDVKHQNGKPIWQTGPLPMISQDHSRILTETFDLDSFCFRVARMRRGEKIDWDKAGHIYMFGPPYSQGGFLKAEIDNMNLNVAGKGKTVNDYAGDPGLKVVVKDAEKYYSFSPVVKGGNFSWEFDLTCKETNRKYWGMVAVGLTGTAKKSRREYTYTIEVVSPDGRTGKITGVNPGPHWHRPDPNKPTYTITAVLDGKTVTEAELKKGQK